ncbi:hypothetical protein FISHEDRAFT_22101, partial [Fistulina hepatica ATCC 64428]
MPRFAPARASPPQRQAALPSSDDRSRTSTLSVSELANLTPADVELLDAVIERAGPDANTFLTVFKAYNDELTARGLDPHEVIYYGKLLKLGTLKGKNWRDKWNVVKSQFGYNVTRSRATYAPSNVTSDVFYEDEEEENATDILPSELQRPLRPVQYAPSTLSNSLGLEFDDYPLLKRPNPSISLFPSAISSDEAPTRPPSYRTTPREPSPTREQALKAPRPMRSAIVAKQPAVDAPKRPISTPPITSASARQVVAAARQRAGSVVNEDDAWKKIRMVRDEEDAARFHDDKVLEHCWNVWRQGLQWILTTADQIGKARDNLVLRVHLQCWRERVATRRDLLARVAQVSNARCLERALIMWRERLVARQQAAWRASMREKMKIVRDTRINRIRKEAWAKWRQTWCVCLAKHQHDARVISRVFLRWRTRTLGLEGFEMTADEALMRVDQNRTRRCWEVWRSATYLRTVEHSVATSVDLRIMSTAMSKWEARMYNNRVADQVYNRNVLKRVMYSWMAARDRIRAMENRVAKHIARQDDVLLRAVWRVWEAHERGRLLTRVKATRLLKGVWATWSRRIQAQRKLEARAIQFSKRPGSSTSVTALRRWRDTHATHRNAQAFAVQYHSAQVRYKAVMRWRAAARDHARQARQARVAHKFLTKRRVWQAWRERHAERQRERRLRDFERTKMRTVFRAWRNKAVRQRARKAAEALLRDRVEKRMLKTALARWTSRVIELKLREMDTIQKRQFAVVTAAFKKWKAVCVRHVEELNLMESYQFVRREENIRRMFHRWLSTARAARYRRLTLQGKEEEMRLATIGGAWEKWRDKFIEESLRGVEIEVLTQRRRNTIFKAFGVWHSKTKTLPAIRFHASHTKVKIWNVWRAAMPLGPQVVQARKFHRKNVLSKFLKNWVETHRTKLALKAVARARYLRLPTAVPRQ